MLLIILYINIWTLKIMNFIINCNIVPYPYFSHVLLLYILYIYLHTLKYIWKMSITKSHITFPVHVTMYTVQKAVA